MPVPLDADIPQWVNNLAVVAAAAVAAIAGVIYKRQETKKEVATPAGTSLAIVGGTLASERSIERLVDQLSHNERAVRDAERASRDNTSELKRAIEVMIDLRESLEARTMNQAAADAELVQAITMARVKPPE